MRYIYQNVVQDGRGNFVASATVTVTLAGGTTKASIYSALTGGTVDADGIITTGTDGTFTFYVDEANYSHSQQFRIVWSKSGFTSETWDYIQIFPDGDRTLLTGSTVDQGDAAIVGTLAWHVADISTDYATITVLPGDHDLTTAVTVGSTINLEFKNGGVIVPQAGITLTVYSPEHIIASPRQQIIDITNNSTDPLGFFLSGTVYPQWWGAIGETISGSGGDTSAVQCAVSWPVDATLITGTYSRKIIFPSGIYRMDEDLVIVEGTILEGENIRSTKLWWDAAPSVAGIHVNATQYESGIQIRNMVIDMNGYGIPAKLEGLNEWCVVENVEFREFTTYGLRLETGETGTSPTSNHASFRNIRILAGQTGSSSGTGLYVGDNVNQFHFDAVTIDGGTSGGTSMEYGLMCRGNQNVFTNLHIEDVLKPIQIGGGSANCRGNIFNSLEINNNTIEKVSWTFNGITGTFGIVVASNATDYTMLSVRDKYSTKWGDVFLRDTAKAYSVLPRTDDANDNMYQSIISTYDGKIIVDGELMKGREVVNATIALAADSDNLDVSGGNVVEVNTAAATRTIGGLTGGVDGQIIRIIKVSASNNLVIEHDEGIGDQDFLNPGAADITIGSGYGGVTARCNGTAWIIISE